MKLVQWLWKNKIHFVIWAAFLAYMLSASQIYAAFFLKNGKPLSGEPALPAENGVIRMMLDDFRATVHEGEDLYVMTGWVYAEGLAASGNFEKKLVLHSVQEDLIFPVESIERKDLTHVFSDLNINLDRAGFRVYIAKDVLKIDNYRIGMLLEDPRGDARVYQLLDHYIERQPNRLRYIGQ